jgi:Protein of unknown function (DUF4238)
VGKQKANLMGTGRAHHYVPVFYLKGFKSPKDHEYLWVYEQGRPVRKSKPVNEAHERDFYAYEDDDGKRCDLEQPSSGIESTMAPLFRIVDDANFRFHPEEFAAFYYEGMQDFILREAYSERAFEELRGLTAIFGL